MQRVTFLSENFGNVQMKLKLSYLKLIVQVCMAQWYGAILTKRYTKMRYANFTMKPA